MATEIGADRPTLSMIGGVPTRSPHSTQFRLDVSQNASWCEIRCDWRDLLVAFERRDFDVRSTPTARKLLSQQMELLLARKIWRVRQDLNRLLHVDWETTDDRNDNLAARCSSRPSSETEQEPLLHGANARRRCDCSPWWCGPHVEFPRKNDLAPFSQTFSPVSPALALTKWKRVSFH